MSIPQPSPRPSGSAGPCTTMGACVPVAQDIRIWSVVPSGQGLPTAYKAARRAVIKRFFALQQSRLRPRMCATRPYIQPVAQSPIKALTPEDLGLLGSMNPRCWG